MKTTSSPGAIPSSLVELRSLEAFLTQKLQTLYSSGKRADTIFLRALEELRDVLSVGLTSYRSLTRAFETPVELPAQEVEAPLELSDLTGELELAQDEFLLDFGEEILCLETTRELPDGFLPTRLRLREARRIA